VRGIVIDYNGSFDDYEKILLLDDIFLKFYWEEEEKKREAEKKDLDLKQARVKG